MAYGIKLTPLALEVWCLNHWTTREVPPCFFIHVVFLALGPVSGMLRAV